MTELHDKLKTAWIRQLKEDWKIANFYYFKESLRLPNLELSSSGESLGRWKGGCHRYLSMSMELIHNHPWEYVREVLYHEMAHQYVEEILGIRDDVPHGEAFKRVCLERGIDPTATGGIQSWVERRKNRFTVSTENHQILDKVQKLLALAQSPNEHEAQLAMSKAHEMLLRHNLSLLEAHNTGNYLHKQIGEIGRKDAAKAMISTILCKFFFVETIWTYGYDQHDDRKGRVLEVYGTPENVEMAEYVYHYLQNVPEILWSEYKGKNNINGNRHRRTFIYGLLQGFYHKLEGRTPESNSQKLVWKGDPQLTDFYRRRNPRVVRTVSRHSRTCQDAYNSGVARGKNLVIHKGVREKGCGETKYLT